MPIEARRISALLAALLAASPIQAASPPTAVAVAEFDYVDTSGEARDQRQAHADRLRSFAQSLRDDLARQDGLRIVALDCSLGCSAVQDELAHLFTAATQQGADLLIFGSIHKQSTLIQYAKTEVVDLHSQQVVMDRLLTFRGDDDQSWARAEQFLVKDIIAATAPSRF
jgi:hypothetical protein